MAEIIQFPIKDKRLVELDRACAAFDGFLNAIKEDRVFGLYLLQCGPYAKGARVNLPAETVASFICELLEDPDTRYLVNRKMRFSDASRYKED
jgi:hypothetical protein